MIDKKGSGKPEPFLLLLCKRASKIFSHLTVMSAVTKVNYYADYQPY